MNKTCEVCGTTETTAIPGVREIQPEVGVGIVRWERDGTTHHRCIDHLDHPSILVPLPLNEQADYWRKEADHRESIGKPSWEVDTIRLAAAETEAGVSHWFER